MGNHLTHGPRTRALQRRRVDASPRSSKKPRCSHRAPTGTTETGTESRVWRAGHLPESLFTIAEEAHEGVWPRAQWASAPETGQERNRTATARVGPSCAPAVRILCGLSRRNPQSRHAAPHSQTWKLRPPEVMRSLANGRATCKAQLSWPPRQTKTLRSLRELPFI